MRRPPLTDAWRRSLAAWRAYLARLPGPHRTARRRLVRWADWGVANRGRIGYTEGPGRSDWLHNHPPNRLPLATDCSGFATLCYRLAGLADPNGLGYRALGYTGTLLDHARLHPAVAGALPGDLIVYGPGTGEHVVIVVAAGPDPRVVSHGDAAGPRYEHVSDDPRQPKRVCRYLT